MKRYHFLDKKGVFEPLNRLRDAFLAAKNGSEVEKIINALLTEDEKLKLGRRIIIAELIKANFTIEEIIKLLKVGTNTVVAIAKSLEAYPEGFNLIEKRKEKLEKEFRNKAYRTESGSNKIFKSKTYTGIKRKDVSR